MKFRAALVATTALVSIAIFGAGPAAALAPTAPGSAVFIILPGGTATAATVAMQMPNGVPIPIGTLNPTTGKFTAVGLGQPNGPASLSSSGTVPAAQLPIGTGGGVAGLDASAKVAAAQVVNRPTLSPSVTSIGTSAATVFPAGTYVSVRIRMTGSGQSLACTGDNTAPAVGTSTTATAPGQDIFWPIQTGGAMPSGPFQCVASGTVTIAAEAH